MHMPLDHYVSQVHLKQFFSPILGARLYATKKSDLKSFQCHSRDVCRIENGSTNAYLIDDRAIEDFLRGVEPNYDASLDKLRRRAIDRECIGVIAGFAAYVSSCSPAAMRIHSAPLVKTLEPTAIMLDRKGVTPKAPPSLGSKSLSELLAEGVVGFKVDPKYPQALGISSIRSYVSLWGNSTWEILGNEEADSPFFTSDHPVAPEARGHGFANRIVPLAPDLAIRIIPDVSLSRTAPDFLFQKFSCRYRTPPKSEVVEINRLIVRSADDIVFYRDDLPWVRGFIERNRHFRIDMVGQRIPQGTGFLINPTQQIVPHRYGADSGVAQT